MKRLVLVLTLFFGWTGAVAAQPATDPAGVIQRQLDAFLADDFARAFTFASPNIKGIFQTPDNFGAMVKRGYPMVWRPADVTFGKSETRGSRVLQTVIIADQAGRIHALEYEMMPVGDSWQINGVRLLEAPQIGA